jgi:hypothetical protein
MHKTIAVISLLLVVAVVGCSSSRSAIPPKGVEPLVSVQTTPKYEGGEMRYKITDVDYAPEELYSQVPFEVRLLRQIAGPDRPDYWLAKLGKPLLWKNDGKEISVTHVILAARYIGAAIGPGEQTVTVGIAYVVDATAIDDELLDFKKCHYSAIGTASAVE